VTYFAKDASIAALQGSRTATEQAASKITEWNESPKKLPSGVKTPFY